MNRTYEDTMGEKKLMKKKVATETAKNVYTFYLQLLYTYIRRKNLFDIVEKW